MPQLNMSSRLQQEQVGDGGEGGTGSSQVVGGVQASVQDLSSNTESIPYGLDTEEKRSIETHIQGINPIGVGESTLAYQKFLNQVLGKKVSLTPFLENYFDALKIIDALKILFPEHENIRLANVEEADKSMGRNQHATGYRGGGSGGIERDGDLGYAWVGGVLPYGGGPFVWRSLGGNSFQGWCDSQVGLSVIPVFG